MMDVKCGLIGDVGVGKRCLHISYTEKRFPFEYIPTIVNTESICLLFEGKPVTLSISPMLDLEYYPSLRANFYANKDIFLLCFSVVNPESYRNIEIKWYPEVKQHCPEASVILVGLKLDLRSDESVIKKLKEKKKAPIRYAEGVYLATKLGAIKYLECSALTSAGLNLLFDETIRAVCYPRKLDKGRCTLM